MGWPTGCPSQRRSPRAAAGAPSRSRVLSWAGAEHRMILKSAGTPARQLIDNPVARLLPIATTLLATVISIQPAHIPGYAALTPAFTLMTVSHWRIYWPDLLPPFGLFLVGITQDLLTGVPPGVTALALLLARAVVLRHRRHFVNRLFPFVWAGFTMVTGGAMLFLWTLHCFL